MVVNKKFIVLGGAGDMGSNAVRYLYKLLNNNGKLITIGDFQVDKAKEIAAQIDQDIQVVMVDANDPESLVSVLKDYDVSINCIGPNFKYAVPIANAVIEAGINGIDICDDYQPTEELVQINEKNPNAKQITYIYGMGWTPGLSNILAKRGAELLDSSHTISIAWTGDPNSEGTAVLQHMLHILNGKVKSYKDGKWIDVKAGKGKVQYRFPEPIGKTKVVDVGHPEPITIPRFMPGLKEVTLKGALYPYWINSIVKILYVWFGRSNTPEKIRKRALSLQKLQNSRLGRRFTGKSVHSTIRVEVIGEKNGKPTSVILSSIGTMGELTSLSAAIGAILIATAKVTKKGVFPPEACIPTEEFLQIFKSFNLPINEEWIPNGLKK